MAKPSAKQILESAKQTESQLSFDRQIRALRNSNDNLKSANATLHREVDTLEGIVDLRAAMQLAQPPIDWQARKAKPKGKATVELLWSDWHVDELITRETTNGLNEWNPKIADQSIKTLVDNSLNLIEIESKLVKLPDLVLWLGGDFISGPIHEELEVTNTMEPDEAICWLKPRIEVAISKLLKEGKFEKMLVVCSWGNHARWTKKIQFKREWKVSREYWMYVELAERFKHDKRVTFHVSQSYESTIDIEGQRVTYEHGHRHKFNGGVGGALVPVNRNIGRRNSDRNTRSDRQRMGHFHVAGALGSVVMNASMIGYSEYGTGRFAYAEPSQTLCVLHEGYGQTLVREVRCR